MSETATTPEEKKDSTLKKAIKKANPWIQMANAAAGTVSGGLKGAGKKNEKLELASGVSGLVASGTGTAAAGIEIAESNQELKELNKKISDLESQLNNATDQSEKDQLEKELENAKGKRSELELGKKKSGSDVVSGLAGMVSSGVGFANGDAAEKAGSISDIVGGGAGTVSGVLGMKQAWEKRKRRLKKHKGNVDKEKSIKSKYWKEMAGGAMGVLGGLLGAGSGFASLFGSEKLAGFLGAGSNFLGVGGSLLDVLGGAKKEKTQQSADADQTSGGTTASASSETSAPAQSDSTQTTIDAAQAVQNDSAQAEGQSDSTQSESATQLADPRADAGDGAA